MAKAKETLPGPLTERRALTASRRDAAREQDRARYRYAEELSARSSLEIPPDRGFLVVPPGTIPESEPVIEAGNALIESIGHEKLTSKAKKGGYMAKGFLPRDAYELDSPYMRFALSDAVVAPVATYLGVLPLLTKVDLWYSVHAPQIESPVSAQQWHLDNADTTQVKVWIHLEDVGETSGPLTALDATDSDTLAERIDYDLVLNYRVSDEALEEEVGTAGLVTFDGPRGTVDFVDTSRCFHMGSRVDAGARPRRLFMLQYVTPYGFKYGADGELPLARLADRAPSELHRLLLGGS